jgi:Astacin (Peptidase family M12A)/Bacterial pre-peptidase C-terminal domain
MAKVKARRMCFDKIVPGDLFRAREMIRVEGRTRALSPRGKQWVNGSTIKIRFLSGTTEQRRMVQSIAPQWTEFANLKFEFTEDARAEIRVSFDPDDGAWSYIGTDNAGIPLHAATLNLGWQDQAVILHEFGHMIGLAHEHQNPEGGLEWNEEVVIRDLSGPPNNWDPATIRHNVLDRYSVDQIQGTAFDPESIMLYAFPDEWTRNPGGTHENTDLSGTDKKFVRSARMYPGAATPDERAVELAVLTGTPGSVSRPGEEDLFKFEVKRAGHYTIETAGTADLVMALFGPGSPTRKLAEDDDSGVGSNPRISLALQPGSYYARVRHHQIDQTGAYEIRVLAAAG